MDIEEDALVHPARFNTVAQVIRIKNGSFENLEAIVRGFETAYEMDHFLESIHFIQVGPDSWVGSLTKPLNFTEFCYFINYLEFPIAVNWKATVTGWTNFVSKEGDRLDLAPEPMMVYVPAIEESGDGVLVTCASGIGYKISFLKMKLEYTGDGGRAYENPPLLP